MLIKNAMVLTEENTFQKLDVSFQDSIEAIGQLPGKADIDAEGYYLVPGLIDLHTHGAVGHDFSDGDSEGIPKMAAYYAAHGITSFCATTMTLKEDTLAAAMQTIRAYQRGVQEARCVGIYLEGPFLSYEKRGAQAADNLHAPDIDMFFRLNEASGNMVKIVGVAPEVPGAIAFIKEAVKHCAVSVAHTTADYAAASAAFAAGATQATHLFNGMNGLHHREPSVIGAAFDNHAFAEIICDGIHVHPSAIRMAFQLFGDKLMLISDSLRCAGLANGNYVLGGQAFTLKDGRATLADGTLAGSAIYLLKAVQNAIAFGIAPEKAIAAASTVPAKAIGMDAAIGSIAVGKWADMLLLNSKFELKSTIINGRVIDNENSGI